MVGLRSAICAGLLVAACSPQAPPQQTSGLQYLGVETKLLEDDLVNFVVTMSSGATRQAVANYARCAAAQYTQIRGFGFARHVRTQVAEEAGILVGDAIYTISPTLPAGLRTVDADATVRACKDRGIPTV